MIHRPQHRAWSPDHAAVRAGDYKLLVEFYEGTRYYAAYGLGLLAVEETCQAIRHALHDHGE